MLEPCEGKLSCTVLRGESGSNTADLLDSWTGGKTLVYRSHQTEGAAKNELSDAVSADLKKRGFKYLGSITVYSHLQACGMINDHDENCFLYDEICRRYPVEYRE